MAYYDRIAIQWHRITGYKGGIFKERILNDVLLDQVRSVQGLSVLEVGAGNGYFLPLALRRFSGQQPGRIVVSDVSRRLLEVAQNHFRIDNAEYLQLDVRKQLPFDDDEFDLVLATMLFNEVSDSGVHRGLQHIHRVLNVEGQFVMTVLHPAFINSLDRRDVLQRPGRGMCTMPGENGIRLPVVIRSAQNFYESALAEAGFAFTSEELFPTQEVLNQKPGLRKGGKLPIAKLYSCTKDRTGAGKDG